MIPLVKTWKFLIQSQYQRLLYETCTRLISYFKILSWNREELRWPHTSLRIKTKLVIPRRRGLRMCTQLKVVVGEELKRPILP